MKLVTVTVMTLPTWLRGGVRDVLQTTLYVERVRDHIMLTFQSYVCIRFSSTNRRKIASPKRIRRSLNLRSGRTYLPELNSSCRLSDNLIFQTYLGRELLPSCLDYSSLSLLSHLYFWRSSSPENNKIKGQTQNAEKSNKKKEECPDFNKP